MGLAMEIIFRPIIEKMMRRAGGCGEGFLRRFKVGQKIVGCADEGSASFAVDKLRASAHLTDCLTNEGFLDNMRSFRKLKPMKKAAFAVSLWVSLKTSFLWFVATLAEKAQSRQSRTEEPDCGRNGDSRLRDSHKRLLEATTNRIASKVR